MDPVTITLADALSSLGSVISSVMTMIEGNNVLFAMFVVPLLGAGIGLVKRLI